MSTVINQRRRGRNFKVEEKNFINPYNGILRFVLCIVVYTRLLKGRGALDSREVWCIFSTFIGLCCFSSDAARCANDDWSLYHID